MLNNTVLDELFNTRKDQLFFYSPYSFLRKLNKEKNYQVTIRDNYINGIKNGNIQLFKNQYDGKEYFILYEYLSWDSDYFKIPTYRLHTLLYKDFCRAGITATLNSFTENIIKKRSSYCYCIIPSEDIKVIQGLTSNGHMLIETRMNYYLDLKSFQNERYPVRHATVGDLPNLRRVAREMVNPYDRFHADPAFNPRVADEFLATYVEASVKGFADCTLVPNEPGIPPDAFITAKYLKEEWGKLGVNVSKMVLSSVSSATCKGWYRKLVSELACHLREVNAEYAFAHPASTNRAVIHTYETLGFKLGQVSHVFSIY